MYKLIRNVFQLQRIVPSLRRNVPSQKIHKSCTLLQERSRSKNIYLVDEDENNEQKSPKHVNKYTVRSFTCGELRSEHVRLEVNMCGWLEYQRMGTFLVLRDGYGQTQFIVKENDNETKKLLETLTYESILKIKGTVVSRPKNMINPNQSTGEIEVVIDKVTVLNSARKTLPFNIRQFQKAKESLRMQYRYMDMRFSNMQRNLRVRSELCMAMREFLIRKCNFVDVETPTFFKATPGGAQEFIVPTRFPNQFYSLVQSPQQFKQMLMAGAIDRYFQIARCYRDETSRPDRQPEFTQLDIEMSFTTREGIMELTENLLQYSWPSFLEPLPKVFPKVSYWDVMESYGTDKPDTRYEFKIKNCTELLKHNVKLNDKKNFYAGCIIFDAPYSDVTKSVKEKFSMNQFPNTKLFMNKIKNQEDFTNRGGKLFGEDIANSLYQSLKLKENSFLFLAFGEKNNTLKRLGKIREDYVNILEENGHKIKSEGMHIFWIIDFPLFEEDDLGNITSAHHPFTAPKHEDMHLLQESPLDVKSQSYDLVLNGNEIAGGSIRIHDASLQENILNLLNIDKNDLQHMLEMLSSGCPPHGGIAVGLDRLLSMILQTQSIRDVIAFPKTFEGRDPLSGAPSPLQEKDKKLYHITCTNSK